MVKNVEELRSEMKPYLLSDMKLSLQSKIQLGSSETPQHIAPEIALLPSGRYCKRSNIENFAARKLIAMELKRHSWV